jgi:folate-binding protein YgfZ
MAIQAPPEIEADYRVLREGAGAVERDRTLLKVTGPDAVDFLEGQVTNDVGALEPGRGAYALLLNPKGRILADLRILMLGQDELWLGSEPEPGNTAAENLAMYKIGRRVDIARPVTPTDHRVISIVGPSARAVIGVDPPTDEHAFVRGDVNGADVVAVTTDVGIDLLFSASDSAAVEEAISGIRPVPETVAEILRIEQGRPRFGIDMGPDNLPGELGLEERAVSFTKGCYVGQEPVARMYHRGHPNRNLRGLELDRPADTGETVTSATGGAREVGRVGSACISPAYGPIALALLRREVEPGERVLVGDSAPAIAVRLPFGTA